MLHDEANPSVRPELVVVHPVHTSIVRQAHDSARTEGFRSPFTVETLQSFEPISPECLDTLDEDDAGQLVVHLKSAGVKNGIRNEQAVNEAVKECRTRGDADWLIILGFSFESNIANEKVTTSLGSFEVTKVRMHDDLMQDGLLKKDKKAASFVTIGERGSSPRTEGTFVQVEIQSLDIYDPIKDIVNPRNIHDIAYWMVDDNYDGSNFIVRQVFFCGGDKDEFKKWQKGLSDMARQITKTRAERTLRIELDDEAFDRLYGHTSHPIEVKEKGIKSPSGLSVSLGKNPPRYWRYSHAHNICILPLQIIFIMRI